MNGIVVSDIGALRTAMTETLHAMARWQSACPDPESDIGTSTEAVSCRP
jgi:hypothetical protein